MSIGPELSNGLRYKDIEPVQGLWLMSVDIVVCFGKDDRCGQARGMPEDVGGRKPDIRSGGRRR